MLCVECFTGNPAWSAAPNARSPVDWSLAGARRLTSAKLEIHRTISTLKAAIAYLEAVLIVLERVTPASPYMG
jgi:hypothetical protein